MISYHKKTMIFESFICDRFGRLFHIELHCFLFEIQQG